MQFVIQTIVAIVLKELEDGAINWDLVEQSSSAYVDGFLPTFMQAGANKLIDLLIRDLRYLLSKTADLQAITGLVIAGNLPAAMAALEKLVVNSALPMHPGLIAALSRLI